MTTISVERVSKQYSDGEETTTAVDDVSFKVTSGESLVLVGPSGSGKTTLLRLIAGLEAPDSGRVRHGGRDVLEVQPTERGVGMVFQGGSLMPIWKARRTVGFFLQLRRRQHELPERIVRISQITGLDTDQLLERYPAHMSGGEQQRVAVARALARDLNVLLLDNPFANLDARLRTEARVELKKLLREFSVTTVYVTHDQTDAMTLGQRVGIMRQGKLVQLGTYQQLYHTPINLFVARFIGQRAINCFPGYAIGGRWRGDNFGGYPIRGDLPDGTRVTLGIRPEFVRVADADAEGSVPGRVTHVTTYFSERYRLVEVRGGGETWSLTVPYEREVSPGTTLPCVLDDGGISYFDTQTGVRIG